MELTEVKIGNNQHQEDGISGKTPTVADEKDPVARDKSATEALYDRFHAYRRRNARRIRHIRNAILLAGYFVYFGFAMKHHKNDEDSWRLVVVTIFGVLLLSWKLLTSKTPFGRKWIQFCDAVEKEYAKGKRSKIIRWFLFIAMTVFMVVYTIVAVARKNPKSLRSLLGLIGIPVLLFVYSNNKRKISWHTVYWGMALQYVLALVILKTSWGGDVIQWCGERLGEFVAHAHEGSEFVFGETYTDHIIIFYTTVQVMLSIIAISVLTYLGVMKFLVETAGRPLAFLLGTSPAEGINAIANCFFNIPESIMLVQEYLAEMTPSQLFITYSGALATVGGYTIITFMSFGVPAGPLLAASVMSAPATLAASKIVFPSHKDEVVPAVSDKHEAPSILRKPKSLADAIIVGIQQSIALLVQIVAFVLSAIVIMEFLNQTLVWLGQRVDVDGLTLEFVFSYIFYPFAYMMGARAEDCLVIGRLLGIRTFSFTIFAYLRHGMVIQNGAVFRDYVAESANNTWSVSGDDVVLDNWDGRLLKGGVIDERSEVITTYALCGSASVGVMGFVLGSMSVIVPARRHEVTRHMLRAMIVGTAASYMTACFAGLLYEGDA